MVRVDPAAASSSSTNNLSPRIFRGVEPLGQRIEIPDDAAWRRRNAAPEWLTIVGVVRNIRQRPPADGSFDAVAYVPITARTCCGTRTCWCDEPTGPGSRSLLASRAAARDRSRSADVRRAADGRLHLHAALGATHLWIDVRHLRRHRRVARHSRALRGDGVLGGETDARDRRSRRARRTDAARGMAGDSKRLVADRDWSRDRHRRLGRRLARGPGGHHSRRRARIP